MTLEQESIRQQIIAISNGLSEQGLNDFTIMLFDIAFDRLASMGAPLELVQAMCQMHYEARLDAHFKNSTASGAISASLAPVRG